MSGSAQGRTDAEAPARLTDDEDRGPHCRRGPRTLPHGLAGPREQGVALAAAHSGTGGGNPRKGPGRAPAGGLGGRRRESRRAGTGPLSQPGRAGRAQAGPHRASPRPPGRAPAAVPRFSRRRGARGACTVARGGPCPDISPRRSTRTPGRERGPRSSGSGRGRCGRSYGDMRSTTLLWCGSRASTSTAPCSRTRSAPFAGASGRRAVWLARLERAWSGWIDVVLAAPAPVIRARDREREADAPPPHRDAGATPAGRARGAPRRHQEGVGAGNRGTSSDA